jgi:4-hydroxy-2-oxoglutarate aldolase
MGVNLQGIVPPLVTPFRDDGRLDLRAFEANLEAYAGHDLAGYLVLGSNGEAASLEEDEKLALLGVARGQAGSRLLLAGTGLESTRATIALTKKAADRGVDAALVLTPSYYKARMTPEALQRHFEAVAEASLIQPTFLHEFPTEISPLSSGCRRASTACWAGCRRTTDGGVSPSPSRWSLSC